MQAVELLTAGLLERTAAAKTPASMLKRWLLGSGPSLS
jgi:hypothetical protein